MERARFSAVAAVVVLVFWGHGLAGAQTVNATQPDEAPGERVVARVQLRSTPRVGGGGAVAQDSLDLRPGETGTVRVWVGRGADGSCLSVVGAGGDAQLWGLADVQHVWEVTVQLVSAEIDQVQLQVDWKRYSTDPEGRRVQVAGDVRTPSIAEQTPHLLDFVAEEDDACRLANVRLEVEAMMAEAAAFVGRGIDYDLWLVHESADGQRDTRRRIVQGQHGQRTTFWFPTLAWQRPGSDCTLSLTVRGELRGRLKPDGSVDLTVSPTTVLRLSDTSGAAETGRGIGSRSLLSLTPGEVVEVQMPLGFGRATIGQCAPVEFAEFFSGHSTSILVSAAPQSQ